MSDNVLSAITAFILGFALMSIFQTTLQHLGH